MEIIKRQNMALYGCRLKSGSAGMGCGRDFMLASSVMHSNDAAAVCGSCRYMCCAFAVVKSNNMRVEAALRPPLTADDTPGEQVSLNNVTVDRPLNLDSTGSTEHDADDSEVSTEPDADEDSPRRDSASKKHRKKISNDLHNLCIVRMCCRCCLWWPRLRSSTPYLLTTNVRPP